MLTTHTLLTPPSPTQTSPNSQRKKSKQKQSTSSKGKQRSAARAGEGVTVDAMAYLDEIQEAYRDQPEVYREFLALMQDFKSERTTVTQTITRVAVMFRSNTRLYEGFNSFLPPGYGIVPVYRSGAIATGSSSPKSEDSDMEDLTRQSYHHHRDEVEVVITTPDGVERRVFR